MDIPMLFIEASPPPLYILLIVSSFSRDQPNSLQIHFMIYNVHYENLTKSFYLTMLLEIQC